MFGPAKLIRIVPDQPGKGGMKTAVHSHQAVPLLDTYNVFNAFVYLGRWRRNKTPAQIGFAEAGITTSVAMHVLYSYSTSDPTAAPTSQILIHDSTGGYGIGTNTIWNALTNAAINTKVATCSPAVFENIKGKAFIAWGSERGFITNGTGTLPSSGTYYIGLAPPATSPTYAFTGKDNYTVWTAEGSPFIVSTSLSPSPAWSAADEGRRIDVNGARYQIGPSSDPDSYVSYTSTAGPGVMTNSAGSLTATVSAAWPTLQQYGGLRVTVGSSQALVASYTVSGSVTTITFQSALVAAHAGIAYTLDGQQFKLTTNITTTAWSASATIWRGDLSWTGDGPQYAYAYIDQATGHLSNLSPILSVTEDGQAGVNLAVTNFTNPSAPDASRLVTAPGNIRLFRTLLNGGVVLYQLTGGPGQPDDFFIGTPDAPYWDGATFTDSIPDSGLNTLVVGPRFTNNKPTWDGVHDVVPVHMAYWDGRVWLNPIQAPSFLVYSASADQAPIGVPEECYPQGNVLTIPAADGRVTGMKVIGPYLVVTTERYAYYVAGFNESNYRFLRFATTMYGVGDYQMEEIPNDTGDGSNIVYLGKDNKVYVLSPGSGATSISEPIADQILANVTTPSAYVQSRVHVAHIEDRRVVLLRVPNHTYIYDIQRRTWTETQGGPTCFATQYGGAAAVLELFALTGTAKYWLTDSLTTAFQTAYVQTFSSGFTDGKGKKKLDFVRFYVSDNFSAAIPSRPWLAEVIVDDKSSFTTPILLYDGVTPQPDQIYTLYPTGATPIDGANCKELLGFPQDDSLSPALAPVTGFRFSVRAYFPANTTPCDLLAIDLAVSELQDSRDVTL